MALFSFSSSCQLENVNFMTAEKCKQYNSFKIVGRYGIKLHVIKLKATTPQTPLWLPIDCNTTQSVAAIQ
jgi:hypothetical protein